MPLISPRPLPERKLPVIAGAVVVVLALPVFLAAGWPLAGWGLGAGLWGVSQLIGLVLARRGIGAPTLSGSGAVAFGMMSRGIVVMVVAIVVASFDVDVALGAALLYAAAFTTELALSLTTFFSGSADR